MRLRHSLALGIATLLMWLLPARAVELGEPYFETVVEAEAIPNGVVRVLKQDATGLLWMGTQGGVFSYDGYRLRPLLELGREAIALSQAHVHDLEIDDQGRLWIATASGLFVHDPASRRTRSFHHDPARAYSLANLAVYAIADDGAGGLWIGSNGGLDRWRPDREGFEHRHFRSDAERDSGEEVRSLLRDSSGDLWVGTLHGLYRLPAGGGAFAPMFVDTLGEQSIWSLFEAHDRSLWVGTQTAAALRIDPNRETILALPPNLHGGFNRTFVLSFAETQLGTLWISSYGSGIAVVEPATGKVLKQIRNDPLRSDALAIDNLGALLVDRSGLLWIGTWGAGLQRHNPGATAFRSMRRSLNDAVGLSQADVYSVLEDVDGLIWVGFDVGGIDLLDRERGVIGGFQSDPADPEALGNGGVSSLALTQDGQLWVGTELSGLHRFRRDHRNFQHFRVEDGLANNGVRRLLPSRSGGLWIGTFAGLSRWDSHAQQIDSARDEKGKIVRTVFWAMAEDAAGRLWVGSANGLFVVEPGEWPRLRRVEHRADGRESLSSRNVSSLLFDRQGRLWVDTAGGLDRLVDWDGKVGRFESVSAKLQRPRLSLGSNLQEDGSGRLWSADHVFDPERGLLEEFGRADGVDLGTNWKGTATTTRDGLLLFGGTKGLLLIDPMKYAFKSWRFEPPVIATELQIDGATQRLPSFAQGFTLNPNQRRFSLEFAALDFSSPEHNRYAYQLEGYDGDWIDTDARNRTASYGGLWPGSYTLRVRGSNRMGAWSPHELSLPITVLPAFWQTAWFAALVLFAAWGATYGGFRWRTARIRARARELQALVEQRTAELRNSHALLTESHAQLESTHADLESTHSRLIDTQQQLVLSEKMAALGTLTAGVAHEINNPTNFADVAVQNLVDEHQRLHAFLRDLAGDTDPEILLAFQKRFDSLSEMAATAREGHKRIKAIVLDLRQFTRLDEAERKPVPIAEPIQSTVNLIRTKFDRVRFELDLAFNPTIECQPAKLGQVFMNLIVNACDAIEQCNDARAGYVRIATATQVDANDTVLAILVEDNGCGMDATTQAKVFEPFFTTKPVGAGTGMGMAIAFGIIKEHGGRIELESTLGKGSRFVVLLPMSANAVESI